MPWTEEQKKACQKAMRLLEHMDRTEKGLYERLLRAGFSEEASAYAMEYVKSYGYINDERYAGTYIAYRIHSKSRQKILQELSLKGIDRETALKMWEETADLEKPDELAVLCSTIEKKYPAGSRIDEKEFRRLVGFLSRRGFQWGDISHALEELDIKKNIETIL